MGLYWFGVEEFGKLLLLKDSKGDHAGDQYAVDMTIFGGEMTGPQFKIRSSLTDSS
ncbi:MAG TPA: hypothetical protein VH796_00215 [Nitrososphaeraceae archaeon]